MPSSGLSQRCAWTFVDTDSAALAVVIVKLDPILFNGDSQFRAKHYAEFTKITDPAA